MFLASFYYIPNNDENVSHKISEFDKEKTRGKEHNSSQSAKSKESSNDLGVLDRVRLNNADRLIIGHLNINSLRNKFEMLRETVQDKLDILLISETKGDPSFPSSQFAIEEGFSSPFRLDRNSSGGGIMLFVREELPSKPLSKYKQNSSVENIFIEKKIKIKEVAPIMLLQPKFNSSKQSHSKYKQRSRFLFVEIRQLYHSRRF